MRLCSPTEMDDLDHTQNNAHRLNDGYTTSYKSRLQRSCALFAGRFGGLKYHNREFFSDKVLGHRCPAQSRPISLVFLVKMFHSSMQFLAHVNFMIQFGGELDAEKEERREAQRRLEVRKRLDSRRGMVNEYGGHSDGSEDRGPTNVLHDLTLLWALDRTQYLARRK